MRKFLLAILLALSLQSILIPAVRADVTWTCTFDFTLSNGGFASNGTFTTGNGGTWSSGAGWQAAYGRSSGNSYRMVQIARTISSSRITFMQTKFNITNGTQSPGAQPLSVGTNIGLLALSSTPATNGTGRTFSGSGDQSGVTQLAFRVQSGWIPASASDPGGSATVTELIVSGIGTNPFTPTTGLTCSEVENYTKPIAAADLHAWGIVERQNPASEPQDHAIFAYSSASGMNVYAATDGTITSVRRAVVGDCDSNFGRGTSYDSLLLPPECSFDDGGGGFQRLLDGSSSGSLTSWIVTLFDSDSGRQFNYFVDQGDIYATEGQTVTGGCLIGKTMRIDANELPQRSLDEGAVILNVKEAGTIIDAIDQFTEEPDTAAPCNQDPQYEECLGDVQLRDPNAWTTQGDVIFLNPGFGFGADESSISTSMNLDGALEPELIVKAQRYAGSDGEIELTIGQTVAVRQLTTTFEQVGSVSVAGAAHEADGEFYTIRVKNLTGSYLDVFSICVRFTKDDGGDPVPDLPDIDEPEEDEQQQACIFASNSFDNGTGEWSVSGSVEGATGEIRVPSGQTFSQNVSVAAGSYTVTVVASLWHYDSYAPDDENTTGDVTLAYDYPADGSFTTIASKTYGAFAQNNNLVTFHVAYNPGSDQTGTFTFKPTLSSAPTGVRGVAVRAVCIDDGDYNGGDDGQGGGDDTPFEESCDPISQPTGSDVGVWLRWHWAKLNGFYRCELMIFLNTVYKFMRESWTTTAWSIRWNQEYIRLGVRWFTNDLILWLNGHLSNIAVGQVTTINSSEQCGNLFCLIQSGFDLFLEPINRIFDFLDQLLDPDSPFWVILRDIVSGIFDILNQLVGLLVWVVQQVFTLLVTVVYGIILLVLSFINLVFELFTTARDLLTALLSAWHNATPQTIPGVVDCVANPRANDICVAVWLMDNTAFAGRGEFFIPALTGILSIHLLLWVIEQIMTAINQIANNS